MKNSMLLVLVVFAVSCGQITAEMSKDGGGGMGGESGAGGAPVDAAGGMAGVGVDGAAGKAEVDAGTDTQAPCVVTACNTCANGVAVPAADGTMCGGGLCDGVRNFVGQYACVATNYACQSGVCTATSVDCCKQLGCQSGDSACTGTAGSATSGTWCNDVCVAR